MITKHDSHRPEVKDMSIETTINLMDAMPSADHIHCASCKQAVQLFEVFDAWEVPGADREACPRCHGAMLHPLVSA